MNSTERLEILSKFREEEPNDPFNHYSYALELSKQDLAGSIEILYSILDQFPNYVPVYYTLGKILEDNEKEKTALDIYEKGIIAAEKANDLKAIQELKSAFSMLKFELED